MTGTDEYTGPWTAAMVKCLACGYEQVSVYPADLELVQCGKCGEMTCAAHDWRKKKRKR